MPFAPTDEQVHAVKTFLSGRNLVLEAGAGCGKTATLRLLAEARADQRMQYIAFNRAIVNDASGSMPQNTNCSTAHSLAFRAVGHQFKHRLNSPRMKSYELSKRLALGPVVVSFGTQKKVLQPGTLAGLVMRAVSVFCQTADAEPAARHIPYIDGIDLPRDDGTRTYRNNDLVREELMPAVRKAWRDVTDPKGSLPYKHEHYLKLWQLSSPYVPADVILLDEAQDTAPVLLAALQEQTHAQIVAVGDSSQAIYEWLGAVDALTRFDDCDRATLSESFRFGPAVADVANRLLGCLPTDLHLVGRGPSSTVGPVAEPRCVLTRTNAEAVLRVLDAQKAGKRAAMVGGAADVASFARAARQLMDDGRTYHPELVCFESWSEVHDYCLAPETRVLTTALEYVPIGQLVVGDELLGFEEEARGGQGSHGRQYMPSVVEAVSRIERPCFRLTMDDGAQVVASIDHRWLMRSGGSMSLRWRTTGTMTPGLRIVSVGTAWEREESWEAGWLSGLFDGEGSLSPRVRGTGSLQVAQKEGAVLDLAVLLLKERGFDFSVHVAPVSGVAHITIRGGLAEKLRLLGTLRPVRLLAKAQGLWQSSRVEARTTRTVVAVEDVGVREVVAVQTSTRTFIAEGLLSHNCQNDPQGSELALMVKLIDNYGPEAIIQAVSQSDDERSADVVVSTAHKSKGRQWDSVQLASDFKLEPSMLDATLREDWPELRLLYVAVTRAQRELDVSSLPVLTAPAAPAAAVPLAEVKRRECPSCGRTDVYREGTGLIGAHHCLGAESL